MTSFTSYRGRWLRCVYTESGRNQPGYNSSPRITALGVRFYWWVRCGGSQSNLKEDERLGISNGMPGQTFQLQETPVLERREHEYIIVTPPSGLPQRWQEVRDFADSTSQDLHYTIDSITGTVQFGPLIREPSQIKLETEIRKGIQLATPDDTIFQLSDIERYKQQHQYGAIPVRGAEVRMVAYHSGGGRQGNVQAHSLRFLKSAIPYVASVTNHKPAINGADAESLEQAVVRAPRVLRTRDRAGHGRRF